MAWLLYIENVSTRDIEAVDANDSIITLLCSIVHQMKLLNVRIEEAFETRLGPEDLE